METEKKITSEQLTNRDLSEQIKIVTKERHDMAENTEMMLDFKKRQVTLQQYKLLLSSLHEIYRALEEAMEKNSDHPGVAPIYFPAELGRLAAIEEDLEFYYGQNWREKIVVPAATERYCHRIRQIGNENPMLLLAHAYTRYLGDLSGGQFLSRIAQKSFGLKDGKGLSFFEFPGMSSPSLFKQLYRSRMDSVDMTEEERNAILEEAKEAFSLNIQLFDELQKMLRVTENTVEDYSTYSKLMKMIPTINSKTVPPLRMVLGLFMALATISMGIYVL